MKAGPRFPASLRTLAALTGLFSLSLLLRAWGLGWGIPHAGRYYPYHPDEAVVMAAECAVNPLWGDLTPGFYNYGSLFILLARLAYDLLLVPLGWGTVPRFDQPFSLWVTDFGRLLLAGRWVAVLLGSGTVLATFALGRRLFSERAGWLAAGFLAVAPLPVLLGHYLTVDIPATFFTTLCLLLAAAALRTDEPRRVLALVAAAGFVAGLAVGTKYNSAAVLLSLAVPLWRLARGLGWRPAVGAGAAALALALIAFLLSTPGALLEPDRFVENVLYELGRNREGQGLIFRGTPPALLYHLGISLPVGLEWPLYVLALAGVFWSLRARRPEDALLLFFLGASFLMLAPAERKFLRYTAPLIPPLLVLAARLVDEGLASTPGPLTQYTARCRIAWRVWAGLAGAAALASTVAHLGVLAGPDVRDSVAAYLARQAAPGDIVALGADPWYYTPPVHRTTGQVKQLGVRTREQALAGQPGPFGGPPVWDQTPVGSHRPDLFHLEDYTLLAPTSTPAAGALSGEKLREHQPRFVILSDYEFEDPERIRRADPGFAHGILELDAALRENYAVTEFRPRPSLFGFTWWRHGIPPHDWRYYMPGIRVYERRVPR